MASNNPEVDGEPVSQKSTRVFRTPEEIQNPWQTERAMHVT